MAPKFSNRHGFLLFEKPKQGRRPISTGMCYCPSYSGKVPGAWCHLRALHNATLSADPPFRRRGCVPNVTAARTNPR